jgi:hypothetical protein
LPAAGKLSQFLHAGGALRADGQPWISYRDGIWLGPAASARRFRIAADRVNSNTRDCTPEDQAKSPQEIVAIPKEARHLHTETQGNHAEENALPKERRCALICNFTGSQPADLAAGPEQICDKTRGE